MNHEVRAAYQNGSLANPECVCPRCFEWKQPESTWCHRCSAYMEVKRADLHVSL